jgi:ABC-2 type transport system permease protein
MHGLYAIYRKEMGHYFVSPIAYVVIGVFLFLSAIFFNAILTAMINESFQMEMRSMQFGAPPEFDVPGAVMRDFLGLLATLILFLTPILTMELYAEERKRGTMELLMTSPIRELDIVLGKFLASLSLFVIMLLPTVIYLIFMVLHSDPMLPWRMLIAGYAGVLLLGGSLLALGSFVSSLTENQLIAAAITFAASLFIWVIDILGRNSDNASGAVLSYLSLLRHNEDFTRGVIDTSSLIYYASFIVLFVFLTLRSVDSMRWRRA